VGPVVEGLLAVLGEVAATFFHLDEDDRLPDVVGEAGFLCFVEKLFYALFECPADFLGAFLAEGMEGAVEEDLGFAFFVALDVLGGPGDEILEEGFAGLGHGTLLGERIAGRARKVAGVNLVFTLVPGTAGRANKVRPYIGGECGCPDGSFGGRGLRMVRWVRGLGESRRRKRLLGRRVKPRRGRVVRR
jgi:hypothetical protein